MTTIGFHDCNAIDKNTITSVAVKGVIDPLHGGLERTVSLLGLIAIGSGRQVPRAEDCGETRVPKLIWIAILPSLFGCARGSDIVLTGADDFIRFRVSPHDERSVVFQLDPPIPKALAPGATLSVSVRPRYDNGDACRFCKIQWETDQQDIVAVYAPTPPCAGGRCVTVEAVSPGKAVLSVELCPSQYADCERHEFELTVMREP